MRIAHFGHFTMKNIVFSRTDALLKKIRSPSVVTTIVPQVTFKKAVVIIYIF